MHLNVTSKARPYIQRNLAIDTVWKESDAQCPLL